MRTGGGRSRKPALGDISPGTLSAPVWFKERTAPRVPQGKRNMTRFWMLLSLLVLVVATLGIGVFLFLASEVTEYNRGGRVTSENRSDAVKTQSSTQKSDRR